MACHPRRALSTLLVTCAGAFVLACAGAQQNKLEPNSSIAAACDPTAKIAFSDVRAIVTRRCTSCHSPSGAAGPDYDWTNDRSLGLHRKNVAAQVGQGSMPPVGFPRLSPDDRRTLVCWGQAQTANTP